MSRPIFSPVAAVEAGGSLEPPPTVQHAGHRTLAPGQRIIDRRLFYSAAWLDHATSTPPEPPALKRGRDADRARSGRGAPSEHGADGGPTEVRRLGWSGWSGC